MWGDIGRCREVSGRYRRGEGGLQQARRGGGGARRELDAAVPGHERGDEEVLHAVERREERAAREQAAPLQPDRRGEREEAVPVRGLGRRSAALRGPLEGWWVASKRLGPLPRRRRSALAHGCGRGGRVVLPLPRAAAVSTGLRVPLLAGHPVVLQRRVLHLRLDGGGQGEAELSPPEEST